VDVVEEVDGIAKEELVTDVAEIEVVEGADEVAEEGIADVAEVAVLVSDSGRAEARIQK
jgi:hypothetical protein